MEIKSPSGKVYVVGEELGSNARFKLYQCADGANKVCILKIARKTAFNGLLDREAFVLDLMRKEAADLEEDYRKIKNDKWLNYHFFFPSLVECFISEAQGNSRISILSFSHVAESLGDLTPIGHLRSKEGVRVDPRSSAWIMGKLLKLLVFTQSQNISIGNLDEDNILINRKRHYVSIFDWTNAIYSDFVDESVSSGVAKEEITKTAKEITKILGGDLISGKLLPDKQLEDGRYEEHLHRLASGLEANAGKAHQEFYGLLRSLWPQEFHEFTGYPVY